MKALEKDRTRRYETASDFAHDIQRYLADEPIEARRPTLRERLAKWARRHRKIVSSAAVFLFGGAAAAIFLGIVFLVSTSEGTVKLEFSRRRRRAAMQPSPSMATRSTSRTSGSPLNSEPVNTNSASGMATWRSRPTNSTSCGTARNCFTFPCLPARAKWPTGPAKQSCQTIQAVRHNLTGSAYEQAAQRRL